MMQANQSTAASSALLGRGSTHSRIGGGISALALLLIPVALWPLTRQYHGLVGDEELYAVQALSRIHSNLGSDLFLMDASQDRYSIFSSMFAWVIRCVGLSAGALALLIALKIWYFTAAFVLLRRIGSPLMAVVGVAFLITTPGDYGAFRTFHFSEDMLTARTLAEAMSMTALALYFHGRKMPGLLVAIAALSVHALIALPAVLLLSCLLLPLRVGVAGAAAGLLISLGIASSALLPETAPHPFTLMDKTWLEVVRERSQFVFLQLWGFDDWKVNIRPFLSLGLSALVLTEASLRKLCVAAMLVGAVGLLIALIAGTLGPIAILLQGQAWRWVWLSAMVAVLLIAPTVWRLWHSHPCGPACALLLIIGWTFFGTNVIFCIAVAAGAWLTREQIPLRLVTYVRFSGAAIGVLIGALIIGNAVTTWSGPLAEAGREPAAWQLTRGIVRLDGCSIFLAWSCGYAVLAARSIWVSAVLGLALCFTAIGATTGALNAMGHMENAAFQQDEFAKWREVIPPTSNVFLATARNSASFAWFTLERPSYLAVDQSSGVIFSRPTALEVWRRSEVLLPIMEPDWRLLSHSLSKTTAAPIVLTADRLVSICRDPSLNFVVAREHVGFDPMIDDHRGPWHGWALYDCSRVNATAGAQ